MDETSFLQHVVTARDYLAAGGVVVAPTESSYALVARVDRPEAIARVMALKGRAADKGMPVVVANSTVLAAWAEIPPAMAPLMALWPAPLTLALPSRHILPQGVLAPDGTLGVRISAHPLLAALAEAALVPLTVTSANPSGEAPALRPDGLPAPWHGQVMVLDGGRLAGGRPSTVVGLEPWGGWRVVREGPIGIETLACVAENSCKMSRDSLWRGRLVLCQPARKEGYRFNLDPILLAKFIAEQRGAFDRLVELGAGCGVLSLLLVCGGWAQHVTAVERQEELIAFSARNIVANQQAGHMQLLPCDLRVLPKNPSADVVAFNPPYQPIDAGRPNANLGRDRARRECFGTLEDFVVCAASQVRELGCLAAIVPAGRQGELDGLLRNSGFVPLIYQPVAGRAQTPPCRVMVWAQKLTQGARHPDAKICEPLVTHLSEGRDLTPEVAAWVDGPQHPSGPAGIV